MPSAYAAVTAAASCARSALLDERDDRAAEAAARHARGDGSVLVGELDEQVEFRGGDLEVVAEALVPLAEQRAERVEVGAAGRLERGDAAADALVLGDDVAEPTGGDVVQTRGLCRIVGLGERHVGRAAVADRCQAALELGAAGRVAGVLERVPDTRVEDDDRESGGSGTWRYSSVPQSSRSACPRRPSSAVAGSISPHGTPTASRSASWASRASSSGGSSKPAAAAERERRPRRRARRTTRGPPRSGRSTRSRRRSRPAAGRAGRAGRATADDVPTPAVERPAR